MNEEYEDGLERGDEPQFRPDPIERAHWRIYADWLDEMAAEWLARDRGAIAAHFASMAESVREWHL